MIRLVRRSLDVSGSTLALIALLPALLLISILVKLTSPGPILFSQERVGKDGRRFKLYKFRSMRASSNGPQVTAGSDVRITPLGRFLRKTKLDELPQFFNVIRGDMSLVGPRPEVPRYVERYTEEQRSVLSVRPGITGLCQVEFRHEEDLLAGRDDVEEFYIREIMPQKLAIDLVYVQNRTIPGDIVILFRTLAAILDRRPRSA